MNQGRVYLWQPDRRLPLGGRAAVAIVPLPNLDAAVAGVSGAGGVARLRGGNVIVRNAGAVNVPVGDGGLIATALGDAAPDAGGDFLFEPGRGGGRIDKVALGDADFRWRYVHAARFGEVNAYFHVDRIATYAGELLRGLGAPPPPTVIVLVHAHHGATELDAGGRRDGVRGQRRWLPFQGGHYRLSTRAIEVEELAPVTATGEIHLGPGWRLLEHGALVDMAGGRYRANASHNPGIIYHEYGHHITRHTADLAGNERRAPERQDNRKTALDEGMSDYFAAMMLETPHIWAFHQRHDDEAIHPRSLASPKTMAGYDRGRQADAHGNGTIWAAALWDLRVGLARLEPDGARTADRLVLACLLGLGRIGADSPGGGAGRGAAGAGGHDAAVDAATPGRLRRARNDFATAAAALLEADRTLYRGRHHPVIRDALARRGIPSGGGMRSFQ
jgi:hypothetical protein